MGRAHGVSPVVVIPPSVQLVTEPNQLKKIELCARTCYKSEGKINDESAERIVRKLLQNEHTAMLEHATLAVSFPNRNLYDFYFKSDRHFIRQLPCPYRNYITLAGNYRAWIEFINTHPDSFASLAAKHIFKTKYPVIAENINTWEPDSDEYREQIKQVREEPVLDRLTLRIVTNRRVSHELVRHRVFSFAQESQRYVNYKKTGKYEIVCDRVAIKDELNRLKLFDMVEDEHIDSVVANMKRQATLASYCYDDMIESGLSQQIAAGVLNNDWKTELCMTGWVDEWRGFMKLRDAPEAHPYMRHIARLVKAEVLKYGITL